jgi:hypothetical protein
VIPGVGDQPYADGWISALNKAIYPREDVRRQYTAGRGCPLFKSRDTVLSRPEGDPASFLTVCPGEHRIAVDHDAAHEDMTVVWWAPDVLSLGAQASFGLRRDDLIVKDVPAHVLRAQLDAYEAWKDRRRLAIASGQRPALDVVTATEWARRRSEEAELPNGIDVVIESVASGSHTRPGGPRFGALVHALLARVPLTADDGSLTQLAEAQGRVLGATVEEVVASQQAVRRVLRHELLRDAARAEEKGLCHRETPVTWRAAEQTIVEGNVDLAYVTGDEVVVVDFKTDRELDGALETYRRQLQVYASAVGAALGKRARAVLMRV